MSKEFHRKYRPKVFKRVIGQRNAVKTLRSLLERGRKKFPHALLFVGPSGCGKTTLARIVGRKLKCGELDFTEVDCADFRGIEMIRELRSKIHLSAIAGKNKPRIWLIDEAHQMTTDAQNAMLKMLEEPPRHVYFMLATTDPTKLKLTVRNRCQVVAVEPLARQDMDDLIADIAEKEDLEVSERVVSKIREVAEGSARKAVVLLNQISELTDEDDALNAIKNSDIKEQAYSVAQALMKYPHLSWDAVKKILKGVDQDAEQIRYSILGYCKSILLGNNKRAMARAALIIDVFRDNLIDSKLAGLVANCWEIVKTDERRR